MHLHTVEAEPRVCPDPCAGPCAGCPDRIVCRCLKVTEAVIVETIVTQGVRSVTELRQATGAGDGCTCCHAQLREYLAVHAASSSSNMCSAR
jgi:bacterioferritin-associated ferredoxin